MAKKKKKVKHHYLTAEQRPLFPVMHKVQESKLDKAKSRANLKKDLRKALDDL